MVGAGLLHFDLSAAVAGVNVGEVRFAVFFLGSGDFGVEVFVDVHQVAEAAHAQTQVVETGGGVVGGDAFSGFLQAAAAEEQQVAEVEVVAQRTELVVDDGAVGFLAVNHAVGVGVEHGGAGIAGEAHEAFESEVAGHEGVVLGVEQHEVGIRCGGDFFHCSGRCDGVDVDEFAAIEGLCIISSGEQEDFGH